MSIKLSFLNLWDKLRLAWTPKPTLKTSKMTTQNMSQLKNVSLIVVRWTIQVTKWDVHDNPRGTKLQQLQFNRYLFERR